jgi:hypothetical protein
MPAGRDGKSEIAERLRATAEDLMELVAAQVKLMRLELVDDVRALGARLLRAAIFLPLLSIGYTLLAGAGAYALGTRIGFGWSFALVGVVHAVVGGWGLLLATRTVRQVRVLDRSRDELERSIKTVAPAALTPPEPSPLPIPPASSGGRGGAAS